MNKRNVSIARFVQDLYDLMGMNGVSQSDFFFKYVEEDDAFMVDAFEDESVIYFDDVTITIKPN